MRRLAVPFVLAFLAGTMPAFANVVVTIDKSTQRMSVAVDGATRYSFAVSTGRAGYGTPNGTYRPERLARTWFSKKYYNSPMPHSIFFHGGFAIHGSYEISRLGGPASHGCVRLHPSNAATLYALVQREGAGNTSIVITGSAPAESRYAHAQPRQQYQYEQGGYDQQPGYQPYPQAPAYYQYQRPNYGQQAYPYWR
jgi:hypothetical protein